MPADLPVMVEMGQRFFDASGYSDITEFDSDSFIRSLVSAPDSVFLVAETDKVIGMAGALIYPFYFNTGHKTAQELFWWVDPGERGIGSELFEGLLKAVKEMGAQSLTMISLEHLPGFVGEFYERRGFRPSERSYIRRI